MSPPVTIQIGSLHIDQATLDADGNLWGFESMRQWWESPNTAIATQQRAQGGVAVTNSREDDRPVALVAVAYNPSLGRPLEDADAYAAVETMRNAADALLAAVLMKVTDPALALQSYVRLAQGNPIRGRIDGARALVHVEVDLIAPDGRRYAQTADSDVITLAGTATTGTHASTNSGNRATAPTITIHGPATSPKIQNTTLSGNPFVQYVGVLGALDILIIDVAAGTIEVNGTNVWASINTSSRLFNLAPGSNSLTYTRTAGASTSTATVAFRDAYR